MKGGLNEPSFSSTPKATNITPKAQIKLQSNPRQQSQVPKRVKMSQEVKNEIKIVN